MTVSLGNRAEIPGKVYRRFALSSDSSRRLRRLAKARRVTESEIVEKALSMFFSLAAFFEEDDEREPWRAMSERSFERVWDNDQDAVYDHWRTLYGVSEG
jgi:hypothetical protein